MLLMCHQEKSAQVCPEDIPGSAIIETRPFSRTETMYTVNERNRITFFVSLSLMFSAMVANVPDHWQRTIWWRCLRQGALNTQHEQMDTQFASSYVFLKRMKNHQADAVFFQNVRCILLSLRCQRQIFGNYTEVVSFRSIKCALIVSPFLSVTHTFGQTSFAHCGNRYNILISIVAASGRYPCKAVMGWTIQTSNFSTHKIFSTITTCLFSWLIDLLFGKSTQQDNNLLLCAMENFKLWLSSATFTRSGCTYCLRPQKEFRVERPSLNIRRKLSLSCRRVLWIWSSTLVFALVASSNISSLDLPRWPRNCIPRHECFAEGNMVAVISRTSIRFHHEMSLNYSAIVPGMFFTGVMFSTSAPTEPGYGFFYVVAVKLLFKQRLCIKIPGEHQWKASTSMMTFQIFTHCVEVSCLSVDLHMMYL